MAQTEDERTPSDLRDGVRSGILSALARDVEMRGGRTARLLATAGVVGVAGAVGVTLLLSGHPYGHHPPWHAVVFGAVWTGLLVVCLALALLGVRTPSLPLARSALVAMLGLALAGICGALCPDQHFLAWWSGTPVGGALDAAGGRSLAALCFGAVTTLVFGIGAVVLAHGSGRDPPLRPLLPAAMLVVLLAPGVALQSVDTSWAVLGSWLLGTAAGAWAGVATGARVRSWGDRVRAKESG